MPKPSTPHVKSPPELMALKEIPPATATGTVEQGPTTPKLMQVWF